MTKMSDPKFDLIEAWERKERLDQEIAGQTRSAGK
jgi:hypothetical protein